VLARRVTEMLGYSGHCYVVHCFKDMSSRDLLLRRVTDAQGDTQWTATPLLKAAKTGALCVLDGLEQLPPATLAALQSLLSDREATLLDGSRLTSFARYQHLLKNFSREELTSRRVFPILPSFRVLALARPPRTPAEKGSGGDAKLPWLLD